MNRRLDNKEETTDRKDKERKTRESYKSINGHLKNTPNQKDNTVCSMHTSMLPLTGAENY
jgi:hypothetical protein